MNQAPTAEGRRAARRQAVFMLYQRDVTGMDLEELERNARRERGRGIDEFTRALVEGVTVDAGHLDTIITGAAEGWTADRIAPLERNILRVAAHELLDWPETPAAVAISEAVQLAKTYCGSEAPAFVNGILGNVARSVRPGEAQ